MIDPGMLLANLNLIRYSLTNNNFDRHLWWVLFRTEYTIKKRSHYYEDWKY